MYVPVVLVKTRLRDDVLLGSHPSFLSDRALLRRKRDAHANANANACPPLSSQIWFSLSFGGRIL